MSCGNGFSHPEKYLCSSTPCSHLSGWGLVEYVLFCNVIWWISYFYVILLTKQTEEWCCRLLTFIHGIIISYCAINDIISNGCDYEFQSTPLSENQKEILSFMLSYFLFDFCWMHFFGNEAWVIYIHHVVSIVIIINVFVTDYGGAGVSYGIAGLEITNPYLQTRWFLRTHGYLNKPIHTIVELWFFFMFFAVRTIGGTILFYRTEMNPSAKFSLKLGIAGIQAISILLQWQMIVYFKKKYWDNRHTRMNFIRSRVSISSYFQRGTLDNPTDDGT